MEVSDPRAQPEQLLAGVQVRRLLPQWGHGRGVLGQQLRSGLPGQQGRRSEGRVARGASELLGLHPSARQGREAARVCWHEAAEIRVRMKPLKHPKAPRPFIRKGLLILTPRRHTNLDADAPWLRQYSTIVRS